MHRINVVLRYPFYTMAGGRRDVVVDVKPGGTIRDLIDILSGEYVRFGNYISEGAAGPEEHVLVIREGAILKFGTPLSDGDTVQLLPPISGG